MFIGSHVSIRDGYLHAAKTAHQLGATAFQFFPKNPRSINVKDFDYTDARECSNFCLKHNIVSIAHAPYPTKLISDNEVSKEKMIKSIINDLEIVEACGSIGVVVHFGATSQLEPLEGYRKMIDLLNDVLSIWDGDAKILIENNAGTQNDMGITSELLLMKEWVND
ncbi:TIM barrel protein [Halalkalibacter krulwichiae]|uniref:Putative endonuclease 4 n=1 Tax=Halalkalibacter krulwichiae TaxID=199441 RepID=A0A1X9M836_9BACI|nr:TIM barrel protein [Halalkalibacter krulwichiae]ARK29576.1 putative endonuclease 4 [Halalkalibacter krulwichiae]